MLSWSILQYFRPSLSYHLSLRPLRSPILSDSLRQALLYMAQLHFYVCLLSISIFCMTSLILFINCLHTGCETESPVLNGQAIAPKVNKIGSFMKYKCAQGHEPTGIPEVQCMPNGEWALPIFACIICEYSYVKT